MNFTQQTFLGASIRGFSSTVGWGSQASVLDVDLVEDPDNGDLFNPPTIGSPVYFKYDDWEFGGILQEYTKTYGEQGNPLYTAQIQDPRELLNGVQIILQDYTGPTYGIDNLYNVFGYLENTFGFGNSYTNSSGMPWKLVRDNFYLLQLQRPISFRGHNYLFSPFFNINILPDYYRVGGGVINAMDFVEDICSAIAHDYFISLQKIFIFDQWVNFIVLKTVDKNYRVQPGRIERFVTNVQGAVSKDVGYEFGNEVTSKFVVGGKLNHIYFQEQAFVDNDIVYDDAITPYWGMDCFDNLILGVGDFVHPSGTGEEYRFRIDGRPIFVQIGDPFFIDYHTDLAEMRHAARNKDEWESFLSLHDNIETSIHRGKHSRLRMMEGISNEVIAHIADNPDLLFRPILFAGAEKSKDIIDDEDEKILERRLEKVYEHIRKYATEYYGKKFMVRIPFVLGKFEPETNNIILSVKPINDGYIDESLWGDAVNIGYMPFNVEKFTTQENKIECYVRFANMQQFNEDQPSSIQCKYNLTKLSPEEFILDQYPNLTVGRMRENLFVKAQVDENLVFLNKYTLFSPRVVITLSSPVGDNDSQDFDVNTGTLKELGHVLNDEGIVSKVKDTFGSDIVYSEKSEMFHMPDLAAIPLESNILRYGPWYATRGPGKVEYEVSDDLVPWEYGGYSLMNLAGMSKVSDALAGQQVMEKGSVQFPGVPSIQLGSALIAFGPIVTDISTTIAEAGVTTTYRMNRWSYKFGRLGKYNVDRLKRISQVSQEQRKAFRQLFSNKKPLELTSHEAKALGSRRWSGRSSIFCIAGDILSSGSGDAIVVKANVVGMQGYKIKSQLSNNNYINKALLSLDGLFVPYSTSPTPLSLNMPHFEVPNSGSFPTVNNLNPFGEDNGIGMFLPERSGIPSNLANDIINYGGDVKAIALKAPVVVGGWGYDINGKPVPSDSGNNFVPNYKNRADLWKVGPLDIRWDDSRKVWNAGGSVFYIGVLKGSIARFKTGHARQSNEYWQETNIDVEVYNPHNITLPSGLKVRWANYNNCSQYLVEPWEWTECPPSGLPQQ
jgi:hypothetical protein